MPPDAEESQFWYDRVGRLVVSQDGRQRQDNRNWYSYTIFDAQGRIIEVGEIIQATAMASTISRDPAGLDAWISAGTKNQVTKTYYDREVFTITSFGMDGQENLRNRVASVTIEAEDDANDATYDYATHYSYDASGNVKTLVQEIKDLHQYGHGYKRIDYDYDYISGNVNMVSYQKDSTDQFFHKYTYDETNRLTIVETNLVSDDPMDSNWERDTEYEYYLHGPLARTEIGERRVQGMDYAYTIQGWIKGMNSSALSEDRDMGKDGKTGTTHDGVAKDAVAYSIGYFEDDYKPISTVANTNFELSYNGTGFANSSNSLYNGNIRNIMLHLRQFDNAGAYAYSYDQLHRIKQMKRWETPNLTSWNWSSGVETDKYKSLYSFDPNGNITLLDRYDENGAAMDLLQFRYDGMVNNRLLFVDDTGGDKAGFEDVIDQDGGNYQYDNSGNLVSDNQSDNTITWSVYGKVLEVNYSNDNKKTIYAYGADQNRVMKANVTDVVAQDTTFTYYIRDDAGNVLATYWRTTNNVKWKEQHLYGMNRLGILEPNVSWIDDDLEDVPYFGSSGMGTLMEGWKRYEISNYLGNVLTVINDRQTAGLPTILAASDYFSFGMDMPQRTFASSSYRYGFNGKEADKNGEFGALTHYDYGFRIYNPGIPHFLSQDPLFKSFPWISSYAFAENDVIRNADLDGAEKITMNKTPVDIKTELKLPQNPTVEEQVQYNIDYSYGYNDGVVAGFNPVNWIRDFGHLVQSSTQEQKWLYTVDQYNNHILFSPEALGGPPSAYETGYQQGYLESSMVGQEMLFGAFSWLSEATIALRTAQSMSKNSTHGMYLATKYNRAGQATHSMIGIDNTDGNGILWFHQTMDFAADRKTILNVVDIGQGEVKFAVDGPNKQYRVVKIQITPEQAQEATNLAKSLVGKNTYNSVTNSCVTCAKEVLDAGGQRTTPLVVTPKQLENSIMKKSTSTIVQESKNIKNE